MKIPHLGLPSRSLLVAGAVLALATSCTERREFPGDAFPTGDISFGDNVTGDTQLDTSNLTACDDDSECPAGAPHCAASGFCFECTSADHCTDGVCSDGYCVPETCTEGEKICAGNASLTCTAAGTWSKFECGSGVCTGGECTGCTPSATQCDGNQVKICRADGSGFDVQEDCGAKQCVSGACVDCTPGKLQCNGNLVERCEGAGWTVVEDCNASGGNCVAGFCVSACTFDPKFQSNSGCDYWAADLDNLPSAEDGPYAVVVANLSDKTAEVNVFTKTSEAGDSSTVASESVAPGQLHVFQLPQGNMNAPGIHWAGYRVQSNTPIVAYQFNPLDNVDVFSNDASLLIPANTFGKEYLVVSRFQLLGGGPDVPVGATCSSVCDQVDGGQCVSDGVSEVCLFPYRGTVSVIAKDPNTTVTVRPTTRTQPGGGMQTMSAGQTYEYTLQPFQVLNIRSDEDGGDLTGTEITSDKPVGVFSGHQASVSNEKCCADHLEQMMFPVPTWGKTYVATKSFPRGGEKDYWRVLASEDDTVVQFEPAVAVNQALNRGEYFEFSTTQDFRILATKPVLVSQLLASSGEVYTQACTGGVGECGANQFCSNTNVCIDYCAGAGDDSCAPGTTCTCSEVDPSFCYCAATGDPAMILAAPVEQFRDKYVFLTPNKYKDDFVNIIAPSGATVTFDGQTIPNGQFTSIPATGFKVVRLSKVTDGVHTVTATDKIGVIVYGYDRDVSYGYAAGLNLSDQTGN